MNNKFLITACIPFFFLLTGCDASNKTDSSTEKNTKIQTKSTPAANIEPIHSILVNKDFKLVEFNGQKINDDSHYDIQFTSNLNISGTMCNQFFGDATIDADKLFAPLSQSRMLCSDELSNNLDKVIVSLFKNGVTLTQKDNLIQLSDGIDTLSYQQTLPNAAPSDESEQIHLTLESELAGHQFKLASVNNQPVDVNSDANIQLDSNLQVSGKMCNNFFGQATLKDDVLSAPQIATTLMLCEDENLNKLDKIISILFVDGATTKFSDGVLTLSNGENVLTYSIIESENHAD